MVAARENLRVLIVHGSRLFRDGLTVLLNTRPGVSVVGSVSEAVLVLDRLDELGPHVALIDLGLPGRAGLRDARLIHDADPGLSVVMMGLSELRSDFIACVEAGAVACVLQDHSADDLVRRLERVVAGETGCSPTEAALLLSRVAKQGSRDWNRFVHLTRREIEIVRLIEDGLGNKAIATRLGLAVQTVKNHVHNILDKLQLDGRSEVARYARDQGLSSTGTSARYSSVRTEAS